MLAPGRGLTSGRDLARKPGTRSTATSFVGSNATTVALSLVLEPNGLTAVSLSPATTWAAVTTVPGAATQPDPSIPSPHAVPITRTTLGAAARTPGRRRTAGFGAGTSAKGPPSAGNGSMRASAWSNLLGGRIELRCRSTKER